MGSESDNRKWLFLECDGGIYALVEKLLFNVFYCTRCDESFHGIENFSEHRCCILHNVTPQYQFGWLIPLPGLLHIDMNGCKAFFELTWDIVLRDFCMKLHSLMLFRIGCRRGNAEAIIAGKDVPLILC